MLASFAKKPLLPTVQARPICRLVRRLHNEYYLIQHGPSVQLHRYGLARRFCRFCRFLSRPFNDIFTSNQGLKVIV